MQLEKLGNNHKKKEREREKNNFLRARNKYILCIYNSKNQTDSNRRRFFSYCNSSETKGFFFHQKLYSPFARWRCYFRRESRRRLNSLIIIIFLQDEPTAVQYLSTSQPTPVQTAQVNAPSATHATPPPPLRSLPQLKQSRGRRARGTVAPGPLAQSPYIPRGGAPVISSIVQVGWNGQCNPPFSPCLPQSVGFINQKFS